MASYSASAVDRGGVLMAYLIHIGLPALTLVIGFVVMSILHG